MGASSILDEFVGQVHPMRSLQSLAAVDPDATGPSDFKKKATFKAITGAVI